jgi:predicted metal-binding membrane protein
MTVLERDRIILPGRNPALAAIRTRLGLVALLFVLAAVGWAWTVHEMRGMDSGPWTDLGGFSWFLGVWVVMMAAMMFPSVTPTVALYSRLMRERQPLAPYAFAAGYLLTWAMAGVAAYGIAVTASKVFGDSIMWDNDGRAIAGAMLLVAAVFELTPLKEVCLGRCRSPLGALLGSWRDGSVGALRMGTKNGAWCVGCCWALMASLFALGVMSIAWMALVAGLIAVEKLLPWRRVATYGVALMLLALGLLLLIAPDSLAGLTIPSSGGMTM